MKKIFSNKLIRLFFITLFFDFLRQRNMLIQWCVNITTSEFAWARSKKTPRMHHLLNTLLPIHWIDSFSWGKCKKDASSRFKAHILWQSLDKRWREHPLMEMVQQIAYAYDINPNKVELPTATAEEVVLALIDIYKNTEMYGKAYHPLGHPSSRNTISFDTISFDKYLTWDRTPQGYNYWCAIYNSICNKIDTRELD